MLLFVMQCVNVLIRRQWTDNGRLTYRPACPPLEITDAQSAVMACAFWAVLHCAYLYGYEAKCRDRPGGEAGDRPAGRRLAPSAAPGR